MASEPLENDALDAMRDYAIGVTPDSPAGVETSHADAVNQARIMVGWLINEVDRLRELKCSVCGKRVAHLNHAGHVIGWGCADGENCEDDRLVQARAAGWDEGYALGVDDERTSADNVGIAGLGGKVDPARVNPYRPPASGMPRPPAQIDGDGSAAEIGSTGVPEPENSIQAAEWQVCITAADGSGFTIPADADSAHRIADRWRTDLASADVEFLVEAERRFVGMWEPVEEWAHFAPYGSYAAVCGEPVPPGEFWETDRGDWAVARFTTRRAGTTCPKCRRILGYSRQEGQADER